MALSQEHNNFERPLWNMHSSAQAPAAAAAAASWSFPESEKGRTAQLSGEQSQLEASVGVHLEQQVIVKGTDINTKVVMMKADRRAVRRSNAAKKGWM